MNDPMNPTPEDARRDPAAVCTLPADGLAERLAWIRSEIVPLALRQERRRDGFAWDFDDTPVLADRLERLVTLERECCSGIALEQRTISGGLRRLEVRGIDPDAAVFATFERGRGSDDPAPGIALRLAKATGIGALVSLILCCALPIAAGALFGAAVAAPLARFDRPWIIGVGMLVFGGAAFAWDRRRRIAAAAPGARAADPPCGPDC